MAAGPVQLMPGFQHPQFHGEIIAGLERLGASRHATPASVGDSGSARSCDCDACHSSPSGRL
jgi:hypothetical protein